MANEYQSNINKKLLKSFAKAFDSNSVVSNTVSKQLVMDFDASTGGDYGQVSMKRPPQYTPFRTPDGDMTGKVNPVRTGKVQAEVSDYITVYVENTQVEEALEADQLQQLLEPIAEDMIVTLESELVDFMAYNAALTSGDPNNAIDAWADVANAGALLKDIGCPAGKKYGVIDCFDEVALANLQTQLGVQKEVMTAWDGAVIKSNFAGLKEVLTTNNLPQYTSGNDITGITLDGTPTATYTAYKDTYRTSLAMTGFTANTGTLAAGQTLTFPTRFLTNLRNHKTLFKSGVEIPFSLTVLPATDGSLTYTADANGDIIAEVSGAAIFEAAELGAFNTVASALTTGDAIVLPETVDKTYRPSLAYYEGFVGMGSVVLPKLHATDSMVMNHKGSSIRVHRFSDGVANKNRYRFDLLPTFACFNPFWGTRMYGL